MFFLIISLNLDRYFAMKIQFQTKEESNKKQLEDFLKLSKQERIYSFLKLMQEMNKFPSKVVPEKSSNFQIIINSKLMSQGWEENIDSFVALANKHNVRMLMVGGGAVNFHGYQRHSADVDFWIETTENNFKKLVAVFNEMGYEITDFPEKVKNREQNISIKFSPLDLNLELITNFSVNKTFDDAFNNSETVEVNEKPFLRWNVLCFDDLITSKIKAGRPKDLLDIQQLQEINRNKK